jgi:hypothetical protein
VIHVYRTDHQPATRFIDNHVPGDPHVFTKSPRRRVATYCCRMMRQAQHCTVQVSYDAIYFWCVPGHGCKGPQWRHTTACAICRKRG